MISKKMSLALMLILLLCYFLLTRHPPPDYGSKVQDQDQDQDQPKDQDQDQDQDQGQGPDVWVSMGLCYSANAKIMGKSHYPYKEVTPLSLLLWRYYLPTVRTIVRVVYTEKNITDTMRAYSSVLERAGALVEWVEAGAMDCVLKSQLIRLFAGENPNVMPDDIVMTVDVNLFVMTKDILLPIITSPWMTAWVPQYEDSASISTGKGRTFNQNLIAMKAKTWCSITQYTGNLTELVERYKKKLGLGGEKLGTWYYDQLITTHALLDSRICTVPRQSGLWRMQGLRFNKSTEDTDSCWHGRGYRDCNYKTAKTNKVNFQSILNLLKKQSFMFLLTRII